MGTAGPNTAAASLSRRAFATGVAGSLCMIVAGCTTAPLDVGSSSSSSRPPSASSYWTAGPVTATLADPDPVAVRPAPVPRLPVTVPSYGKGPVTVRDASRIVAFDEYGTYAASVVALGLGKHLVGRDTAASFPAVKSVPDVTRHGQQVNVEAVLALRPTVVLTDTTMPGAAVAAERIAATGVPVVRFAPQRTVAGAATQVRQVANTLGVPDAGATVARRLQQTLVTAKQTVPQGVLRPRVAFIYARGPGLMLLGGPKSGADDLIRAAGGQDTGTAAGLTAAFTAVTAEGLIKAAPDVIVMMTGGLSSVGGVAGLLRLPGVAQTPAGQHRRVIDMADGQILAFGPRTGEVTLALARALFPGAPPRPSATTR